jgi:histidine triad (HIT) family protein
MASLFSQIIAGEVPAHRVAETRDFLAFLDIMPLQPGHTLIVPKKEIDYIYDLDDETYIGMQLFAKIVAKAIKKSVPCARVGTAIIGLEVPHAHIHLIPIQSMSDMTFHGNRTRADDAALAEMAARIAAAL